MAFSTTERIFKLETMESGMIPFRNEAPTTGEKVPLYIPRLMPEIKMGKPAETKIPSKGVGVFKNDKACTVKADVTMISANNLMIKFEGNTKWVSREVKIDPEKGTRTMEQGLKVTVHAESNVVQDMTFVNR